MNPFVPGAGVEVESNCREKNITSVANSKTNIVNTSKLRTGTASDELDEGAQSGVYLAEVLTPELLKATLSTTQTGLNGYISPVGSRPREFSSATKAKSSNKVWQQKFLGCLVGTN